MIDKLALITLKDGKVAMVRSHNKTLFYAPGGKREAGETDEQALCREIDEELTATLKPDTITFYGNSPVRRTVNRMAHRCVSAVIRRNLPAYCNRPRKLLNWTGWTAVICPLFSGRGTDCERPAARKLIG